MRASSRVILEVSLVFIAVIGVCKTLDRFRSVPWVERYDIVALGAACLFLYVPLAVLHTMRRRPQDFGITFQGIGTSLRMTVAFSVLFLPPFFLAYSLYHAVWFHSAPHLRVSPDLPLLFVYHLLCVALPEEVFYRGYVQSRLNMAFPGRIRIFSAYVGFGWIYTALLFAFGHFLITHRLERWATFLPGLLFGWLRERTGSILAPTLFHALCNAAVLLMA